MTASFRTNEPFLRDLLAQVDAGEVQLPDFQRGWVWDDDHIRALIASVSRSYPIGAVMMLQTGGEGVRFQPRPVSGTPDALAGIEPEMLILDGQQRLTSLYRALRSQRPVETKTDKGKRIERVYYFDIALATDDEVDRFDAIRSVAPDGLVKEDFGRKTRLDVSTPEKQYEAGCVPVSVVCDQEKLFAWRTGFQEHHEYSSEAIKRWNRFEGDIINRFHQYKLPVIELLKQTPKDAVCQVFEQVNTGGVSLTVFELVTASFAAEDFRLRPDWEERRQRLRAQPTLRKVSATDFLTAVTLLAAHGAFEAGRRKGVSCKRGDVLGLSAAEFKELAPRVEAGFTAAARFLARNRVFAPKNVPYGNQLIPLAAILTELGVAAEHDAVQKKLAQWYWCGVFGELYGSATESRFAMDMVDVCAWARGDLDALPRTIRDASFSPIRLLGLQTRQSAAYKGLMARLIELGSHDFWTGSSIELTTWFDLAVDVHHVFPQKWCKDQGLERRRWNSIVNKSPLTARTNRRIGGKAPSEYLVPIDEEVGAERLDEILRTHAIEPDALRGDDFDRFMRLRAGRLLDLVEQAMGKAVPGRDGEDVVEAFGGSLSSG